MSLMVMVHDGPLAGQCFEVASCPRLVRCVRNGDDGACDILNLPEDEPSPGEQVFWYRWDGLSAGRVCYRRPRRSYAVIGLVQVEREPFPVREDDCRYGCCKAGDEGVFSELVR